MDLKPSFFSRDTVTVAKDLLGKVLVVNGCRARIVETEAYGQDPASHAFTRTERSAIMYDTTGHVYVYLIYGMYYCLNFTTEKKGVPGAVLIRAVEPLSGIGLMKKRRGTDDPYNLCSGPGKLCQAVGIGKQHHGWPLGKKVSVADERFVVGKIGASSRIGIKDAVHLQWRFFIDGNGFVSKANISR